MDRRSFLAAAGTGLAAAVAGCAGALSTQSPEWRLRAMPATQQAVEATDVECTLNEPFVNAHPKLERVLERAMEGPQGEWQVVPMKLEAGNELGQALSDFCGGDIRGIYHYKDDPYFVSLLDVRPQNGQGHGGHHHHDGNTTHEH